MNTRKFQLYKGNKPFEETKEFHELLKTQASRLTKEDIKKFTIKNFDEDLIKMLQNDNSKMREAGCELAEAAIRVIKTYDGTHRLSKVVSKWFDTIANEGGRKL